MDDGKLELTPEQQAEAMEAVKKVQRFIPHDVRMAVDRLMTSSVLFSKDPNRETALAYAKESRKAVRSLRNFPSRSAEVERLYASAGAVAEVVDKIADAFRGEDGPERDIALNGLAPALMGCQKGVAEAMQEVVAAAARAAEEHEEAEKLRNAN